MVHNISRFFNIFKYTVFVVLAVVFSTMINKSSTDDQLVDNVFADTPYTGGIFGGEGGGEGGGGSGCGEGSGCGK